MSSPVAIQSGLHAHRSRDGRVFVIRHCASFAELDQCVAMQQATWGYPDIEVVPRNIYVLAQALGGHVLTAWDEQALLAGFAMAIAAHEPSVNRSAGSSATGPNNAMSPEGWMRPVASPRALTLDGPASPPIPYLHSHMLAVAARYQNCGLGVALKLAQRKEALIHGIRHMRWTFDPLMAKNAFFNLQRLGAASRTYIPDFYGSLSSALQGGLPSDRLLAEWPLLGERTTAAIERTIARPRRVVKRIPLPAQISQWKAKGMRAEAEAAQSEIRTSFEAAFAIGLVLDGFLLAPDGGGEYLMVEGIDQDSAVSTPADASES
jgi:predicted GNAT superfamily acetyltransferase